MINLLNGYKEFAYLEGTTKWRAFHNEAIDTFDAMNAVMTREKIEGWEDIKSMEGREDCYIEVILIVEADGTVSYANKLDDIAYKM